MKVKEARERQDAVLTLVLFEIATGTFDSKSSNRNSILFSRNRRLELLSEYDRDRGLNSEQVARLCEGRGMSQLPKWFDPAEFGELLSRANTRVFSPSAWRRSQGD